MDPLTGSTGAQHGDLTREDAYGLIEAEGAHLLAVMHAAARLREAHKGRTVTYSRKVFIPLTTLCRDDCGYCTFKRDPGQPGARYLAPEEVLEIARQGQAQGCKEALFSLGDKPELRFPEAAAALRRLGHTSTIEQTAHVCHDLGMHGGLVPRHAGADEGRVLFLVQLSVVGIHGTRDVGTEHQGLGKHAIYGELGGGFVRAFEKLGDNPTDEI